MTNNVLKSRRDDFQWKNAETIFSKKCPEKYNKDACDKQWDYMKRTAQRKIMTMGTLIYWARKYDNESYEQILKD